MQAYICFIDLIGWRPHRPIEMISSSIDFSHLIDGMTPVPAGMLRKPSLKEVVLTTDVKILIKQLLYGDILQPFCHCVIKPVCRLFQIHLNC